MCVRFDSGYVLIFFHKLNLYYLVCDGLDLQGYEGSLQSPGYPNRVFEARSCRWRIKSLPGSRIRIFFHRFRMANVNLNTYSAYKLDKSRNSQCKSNFVSVIFN